MWGEVMPELPEVETVKNVLKKDLIGLKVIDVNIYYPEMVKTNNLDKIKNEEFLNIKRLGKWLIFETTNYYLVSHLRMEGKYFYTNKFTKTSHDHIIFKLSNNYYLKYNDVRKFGVMYLVLKDKLFTDTPLKELGLEPFSMELTSNYLFNKLRLKKNSIKTCLLDQSIICGIGNIYADEILFKCRINPLKKAYLLNLDNCLDIINNTKEILTSAIKYKGTTIRSYTSSLGVYGSYQDKLLVHTKSICPICKTKINIIKVSGRTTYYCPKCQVENE